MQIEIQNLSVVEYYKNHYNYDLNVIPKVVRRLVEMMYSRGKPMDVDAIEIRITTLEKYGVRKKDPLLVSPKQIPPHLIRRNIL